MENTTVERKPYTIEEFDRLNDMCHACKLRRPETPTKDCNIRRKLIVEQSPVAWKHKHLFFVNGKCKMFKPVEKKIKAGKK